MGVTINCSICISDLTEADFNIGKNSKKYLNFVVGERRSVSEWGHTNYIKSSPSKAQKESGVVARYIGDGKAKDWDAQPQAQAQAPVANDFSQESNSLPF